MTRPRFLQIAHDIRCRIDRGALKEHDSLPSERSLSQQFDVSRMTARRALEALESEGLVYSADRRGRFVSPKRLTYDVSKMVSFVRNARDNDVDLGIDVVQAAEMQADSRIANALELPQGSSAIAYTRLFHTGAYPIFVETEYLPAARFPGFLDHDLRQSTTEILENSFGTSARTGDIVIRMRAVQQSEAGLLGVAISQPVIELEQVIRDAHGVAFCVGYQVWRGEMAEFSAQAIVAGKENRE